MKIFRMISLVALGFLILAALTTLPTAAAPSVTFVVNTTSDTDDGNYCKATFCSLREAINASNTNVGVTNMITFNIPGGGVKTIRPTTALPPVTNTVVINGYSQPGSSRNTLAEGDNAVLRIELDGHLTLIGTPGLTLYADNNVVRGLVMNRFNGGGVFVDSSFNTIEGNFIGTNVDGSAARANTDGVNLCKHAIRNLIGGSTPSARNLISGNTNSGVNMSPCGDPSSYDWIEGNYIGTNRNGNSAVPNSVGIALAGWSHLVGGENAAARNVISGNGYGIVFNNVNDTLVSANYIGTQADGKHALPNGIGIYVRGDPVKGFSQGNRIGGGTKPAANRIAFNIGGGVIVGTSGTEGDIKNRIEGNSIFSNGGLGIDLGNNGVTGNDAGDGDTGPNLNQNYPVLQQASSSTRQVQGRLNSTPNRQFTLEFFKNPACDASGNGEGKTFLGSTTVTTDGSGNLHFTFDSPKAFVVGDVITATATDSTGNTSEFSTCRTAS